MKKMEKDAYYFPHFCNARHDRKVKRMTKELGIEGYGIFFMLLEVLRDQTDLKYPMEDIDLLAEEFGTSEQKVRVVICNYQLFKIDEEEKFFSPKLIVYLQPYFEASEHGRIAANARWNKPKEIPEQCPSITQELPEQCNGNAKKVSKVSNKVSNIKNIPPTVEEVQEYCIERKNSIDPHWFVDFYEARGWMINKNKMKDWKAAIRTWERNNFSKNNGYRPPNKSDSYEVTRQSRERWNR